MPGRLHFPRVARLLSAAAVAAAAALAFAAAPLAFAAAATLALAAAALALAAASLAATTAPLALTNVGTGRLTAHTVSPPIKFAGSKNAIIWVDFRSLGGEAANASLAATEWPERAARGGGRPEVRHRDH